MRASAEPGRNVLHLAAVSIEAGEVPVVVAGVNDLRITRVGPVVAGFAAAHGMPLPLADGTLVATAQDRDAAAVLLRGVNPVIEFVVGRHVVELPGRLVVLRRPGGAAV